jgi:glycosyltransferase involved in cell wall biosynthesis
VTKKRSRRILVVDDRAPNSELGAGYPRAALIVRLLAQDGHRVSILPMQQAADEDPRARQLTRTDVRFAPGVGVDALREELASAQPPHDLVWVSRPNNMRDVADVLSTEPELLRGARLIYDAEALFSTRDVQRRAAAGTPLDEHEVSRLIDHELDPAHLADTVVSVSEAERCIIEAHGIARSVVLSYGVAVHRTAGFARNRDRIAFLGSARSPNSPNAEAVQWFTDEPLSRLRDLLSRPDLRLTLVGMVDPSRLPWLDEARVELRGVVPDLRRGLRDARVLVVPTRTGAGIPLKVLHGAALGIPMVVTTLIAGQLGWENGREALIADQPEEFALACARLVQDARLSKQLRRRARAQLQREFSVRAFRGRLRAILAAEELR